MKPNSTKEKPSHYELLLKAFDKAQTALERAITNEKTAKHYFKTADKNISKSDYKILELEFLRAKYRRKGRKAAFKIAEIRLKQWLKRHEKDNKLYQLTEEPVAVEEHASPENIPVHTEGVSPTEETTKSSKKRASARRKATTTEMSESSPTAANNEVSSENTEKV